MITKGDILYVVELLERIGNEEIDVKEAVDKLCVYAEAVNGMNNFSTQEETK